MKTIIRITPVRRSQKGEGGNHESRITKIVLFIIIGLFVFFALSIAEAVDYYVADPKGIDGIAGTADDINSSDSYPGTLNQPFSTFAKACSVVAPGDTVKIRGGVYNSLLNPKISGITGNPITFQAYPDETVSIEGPGCVLSKVEADLQEPDQWGFEGGIYMYMRSFITIVGLSVKDVKKWTRIAHSDHIVIRDCNFSNATGRGVEGGLHFVHSDYNTICNNIIDGGHDNISLIHSDRNLVEGNHFTSGRHSLFEVQASNFNVFRNNYFSNDIQKIGDIYDSYQILPIEYNACKHNLFEGNDFACTSLASDYGLMAGIQYSAQEGIIRFNVFHDLQVGLDLEVFPESAKYVSHNRVYNNDFNNMDFAGIWIQPDAGSSYEMEDNIFKNNSLTNSVFVDPPKWPHQYGDSASWNELVGKPVQFETGRLTSFVCENNNFFGTGDDEYFITYTWPWTYPSTDPRDLALWQEDYPALFKGNIAAAPSYVDADTLDFHLQTGSPLIDAGTFLTNTAGAGSGTVLPVADARYFFDGYDMTDENGLPIPGDLIQLEGDTKTARVIDIDYVNNTLTLDQPLSWTDEQGVSLAYNDKAPDIGAYEYILYGDVNGNGGVDANDASLTAMAAVGLITLTDEQLKKADVNNNKQPDANDASLIAQYAVGLIDKFPVEG